MPSSEQGGRAMRIAISGPFSSGKTTLFLALRERFPQLVAVPEIASEAKRLWPEIDWRRDDVRGYLKWAQILHERAAEERGGAVLLDGSLVDAIAHERVFSVVEPAPDEGLRGVFYDVSLLCDPEGVPIVDNGIRETDPDLRARLCRLMFEEAERRSRRVVVLSGPLHTRLEQAVRCLATELGE